MQCPNQKAAGSDGWTWGTALKRRMEAYRRTLMLVVCVDDDGLADSSVSLAPGVADENNPAPLVRYRASEQTVRRRDWLSRRAAECLILRFEPNKLSHRRQR